MSKHITHEIWREANTKLVPCAIAAAVGGIICFSYGSVQGGGIARKFVSLIGVLIFVFFAVVFLNIATKAVYKLLIAHNLGVGRASALQFILRVIGYLVIFLATLGILRIPIARLLFGTAVVGIILGVAAQQALANFFASIVLIISHPFTVGEDVTLFSGSLGGKYKGVIIDIGLTHTRLKKADGTIVFLPNATLLSQAAIVADQRQTKAGTHQ